MQLFLEYLPLIVFFVVWKLAGLYWATGALIIASAIQLIVFKIKKEPIPKRNWVFFGLIAVFGGLTIFFQDEAFIKWKVTIINGIFAIGLLISRYAFNKNAIKELLSEAINLPENIWDRLNIAWSGFFALCAILNLYIAFNFSLETWVNFKVFGLMGLTFAFAIGSVMFLYKYMPEEDEVKQQEKE